MKVKNIPGEVNLRDVRVKFPNSRMHHLPRRNYYWLYSLTGFVTWVKTSKRSDRVYPIQMMSNSVLELEVYSNKKKRAKKR